MKLDINSILQKTRQMNIRELYKYLRFSMPNMISDWGRAKDFLFRDDLTSEQKVKLLGRALEVNAYMYENRPRNGSRLIAYNVYKEKYPQSHMYPDKFNELFQINPSVAILY